MTVRRGFSHPSLRGFPSGVSTLFLPCILYGIGLSNTSTKRLLRRITVAEWTSRAEWPWEAGGRVRTAKKGAGCATWLLEGQASEGFGVTSSECRADHTTGLRLISDTLWLV